MTQIRPRRAPKAPRRPRVAGRLELQEQVAELAAQQAAMSEVLRSIANSPHELEPIFDTITANATRLCRAEVGALILFEEHGYRLVAQQERRMRRVQLLAFAAPSGWQRAGDEAL